MSTESSVKASSRGEEWSAFLRSLEEELGALERQEVVTMSCGCYFGTDARLGEMTACPLCHSAAVVVVDSSPMKRLAERVAKKKTEITGLLLSGQLRDATGDATEKTPNVDFSLVESKKPLKFELGRKPGLIDIFRSATSEVLERSSSSGGTVPSVSSPASSPQQHRLSFSSHPGVQDWVDEIEGERLTPMASGLSMVSGVSMASGLSAASFDSAHSHGSPTNTAFSISTSSLFPPSSRSFYGSAGSASSVAPGSGVVGGFQHPLLYGASVEQMQQRIGQSQTQLSSQLPLTQQIPLLPSNFIPDVETREFNYTKCFPTHRKQFLHNTQPRSLLMRSKRKPNFATCISPDASRFALVSASKCLIYAIAPDFNDPPILLCEIASPEAATTNPPNPPSNVSSSTISSASLSAAHAAHAADIGGGGGNGAAHAAAVSAELGTDWGEDAIASMSDNYIAIAGRASGKIRVFDFSGVLVFRQDMKLQIYCMALSPHDSMLAYGIYCRNPLSSTSTRLTRTPMVALHLLTPSGPHNLTTDAKPISIMIPYNDTLNNLVFSGDETLLACSTLCESRFMVISVSNPKEPRLVMKSTRRVEPDDDFEGITSLNFFPRPPTASRHSHHYMAVTSSVFASAPPIILDTKIGTKSSSAASQSSASSSASGVSQPSMLMRVDKVGSRIHNAAVSPRGDALAFLDKSGVVSVMHAPGLLPENRRIAVATEVAAAPNPSLAASIQFSPSGQVLVIVDRKGDVHIMDYGAGAPNQAGVGKCRVLL
ncbi:SPS-sensor component Ptr3p [Trichomonascus vanleenenianus]|uniref:Ptr3p n=1 Tax=Trichomonascus vanleenenianus TaxID=2268995 RepID=UPI003ECB8FC2